MDAGRGASFCSGRDARPHRHRFGVRPGWRLHSAGHALPVGALELVHELGHGRGPAGLVTRAETGAGVAVDVLVERVEVQPEGSSSMTSSPWRPGARSPGRARRSLPVAGRGRARPKPGWFSAPNRWAARRAGHRRSCDRSTAVPRSGGSDREPDRQGWSPTAARRDRRAPDPAPAVRVLSGRRASGPPRPSARHHHRILGCGA